MIPDKVIYTDGRDVTVTDTTLKVKNAAYKINGITKLSLWTIHAHRWPGVLLILLGVAAAVCGWLGLIPESMNMQTENGIVNANIIALWVGAALFVIGLLIVVLSKDRYAVRIGTAEGEKNAIVSTRRDYIQQIVDALNRSFNFGTTGTTTTTTYVSDQGNSTIIR